ncbi:MAG: exosortase E/protease, VPEID-CTERM system, partial [Gammaproteobacteria bacterium]
RLFGQLGSAAKIGVVAVIVLLLLIKDRLSEHMRQLSDEIRLGRFITWSVANILSFALMFMLTLRVFGASGQADASPSAYAAWVLFAIATFTCSLLSMAAAKRILGIVRREWKSCAIAMAVALAVWFASVGTSGLWGPLSDWTFTTSGFLLSLLSREPLIMLPAEKALGIGDFAVNIAPACSGYEGIGLIVAFTAVYVYLYRREVRFPHVFLLFPIGAAAIWLLNSTRIAVLVAIGHYWSPDIAVGGFHSQAGWLTFITTSLLILWLVGSRSFFRNSRDTLAAQPISAAVATLVPFVTLLSITLLSSAFISSFDWLYPLRVIATGVALALVWPHLPALPRRIGREAIAAGVVVAVLWAIMLGTDDTYNQAFVSDLRSAPPLWAGLWLVIRFVGASVTVPIVEELAFRGYLLCRLARMEVTTVGRIGAPIAAVLISSLAFGALHGAWVAGTMAGLVYALVRLRSGSLTDAIAAHSLTNGLLFLYASMSGNWIVI